MGLVCYPLPNNTETVNGRSCRLQIKNSGILPFHRMFHWIRRALITGLLFGHVVQANAQSRPVEASPSVDSIAFSILSLVPYAFQDKDGATRGYFIESAHALLREAKVDYTLIIAPIKRVLKEASAGRVDCVFIANTHATEKHFRFLEPLGHQIPVGVVPKPGIHIKSYEDMANLRIGVAHGVAVNRRFDTDTTLNKIATPGYAGGVDMLVHDRVDAIMGNIDSFRFHARQTGYEPDSIFGDPFLFSRLPVWVACGNDRPSDAIVRRIAEAARNLRDAGTFTRIIEKYR